jgi:hypothetical protein
MGAVNPISQNRNISVVIPELSNMTPPSIDPFNGFSIDDTTKTI